MAKNNAFTKPSGPAPTDPVAEALALEAAATEASKVDVGHQSEDSSAMTEAKALTDKKPSPVVNLDNLTVKGEPVGSAKSSEVEFEVEQPKVTDSVSEKKVIDKPSISAPVQKTKPNTVSRPVGGSIRETSPEGHYRQSEQETSAEFQALITKEKESGTVTARNLIAFMEQYVVAMAPNRSITMNDVLRMQEGLLDNMIHIIERAPSGEFKRLWSMMIAFFANYAKGAFNPRYYSRGAKEWKRDSQQFITLTSLVNLLEASATDLKSVNQQIDVNSVMKTGFSEEARGRMIAFYLK